MAAKRAHVATEGEKAEKVRRPVRPEVVEDMLVAASDGAFAAYTEATQGKVEPAFPESPAYHAIRRSVMALGDVERRQVVLRVLGDEAERIKHDRAASLTGRGG